MLLDLPAAHEVDGLRRALGDSSLGAVAPHITLVPPINIRAGDLGRALEVVRRAAARSEPFALDLGPAATFMPVNPVVYLAVSGPGLADLLGLRAAVLTGPLLRPDRWPFVPHVTLADQASPAEADAALTALTHYSSRTGFDRVVVLEERDRRWQGMADAALGAPAVIGRGGLELEVTEGRLLGPDAIAMLEDDAATAASATVGGGARAGGADSEGDQPGAVSLPSLAALVSVLGNGAEHASIVLTGRRDGSVVGTAVAWPGSRPAEGAHVWVHVGTSSRSEGVGRALLHAMEASARRHGWAMQNVRGYGPAGFYVGSSAWIREIRPVCDFGPPSGPHETAWL
jgi:2'-5' RNA ligase/GNAT superfamily N-acetyltransferase